MRPWLRSLLLHLAAWLIAATIRALRATWRVRVAGDVPGGACLYAFWHGDQVALAALRLPGPVAVLVSRSRDGELGARVARHLGLEVVRGSSSHGAVAAALAMIRRLRAGRCAAIAVDGPRGPRHRCDGSACRLGARAGVPVVPVVAAARRGLVIRSWDLMWVPAPFTTVHVRLGEPVRGELQQELSSAAGSAWREAAPEGRMRHAA